MIVPTLRVGMHPVALCVTSQSGTRSVPGGIPTRSVGTIGVRLNAELIHQTLLLIRQAIERLTHPRRFIGLA